MSLGPNVYREKDGSLVICEQLGFELARREDHEVQDLLTGVSEANKGGRPQKHLIVKIAGIHEGVTLNCTEYRMAELDASMDSWTAPYNKPVITDHEDAEVDRIVGRIIAVKSSTHNGKGVLEFTCNISNPIAVEKIRDGLWQTVSIGVSVKSAVCSICGNDWAKGTWCDHDRGSYYVKDEDQESGKSTLCTWILGGLGGKELSFVTVPADQNAMVIAMEDGKTGSASKSEAYVLSSDDLYAISESLGVKHSGSSKRDKATISALMEALESVATDAKENDVKVDKLIEGEEVSPETADAVADDAVEPDTDQVAEDEAAAAEGDGPEAEEPATDEAPEEEAAEGDADASSESDDSEDDAAVEEPEADGAADEDAAAESDQVAEEEPADEDEPAEESADDATASLQDELHAALITVYVERAISAGALAGTREELIAEYSSHSLDEMRLLVSEQTRMGLFRAEDIEKIRGIARRESGVSGTGDDADVNQQVKEELGYRVRVGDEFVFVAADDIERTTTTAIRPIAQ